MAELRIELFGAFRVSAAGRMVPDATWHRRKPAALIKLLCLAPGHRLHRERLIDLLWPDLDPVAGGANLRKTLHHARRAIVAVAGAPVISSDSDLVWLPREGLWVDVEAFRAAVDAARRTHDVGEYRHALDLYREGLLPEDCYEAWADRPREELRVEYLAVLDEFARLLEAHGHLDDAVSLTRQLISIEPLREDSHAALIRLYTLAGRRAEALRTYEALSRLLSSELGTEPSPQTQRLFEEVRTRQALDPKLTADLWERVGDLRMSGDAVGAAKAFDKALDVRSPAQVTARLERKCAEAWLMHHRPEAAIPHVVSAEARTSEPAERGRLLRVRANLAWETGDIASAQQYAERARDMALEHGTAEDLDAAHEALAIVSHINGEWRDGLAAELSRLAAEDAGSGRLARVWDIHHCIGQYHLYGEGLSGEVEGYARRLLDRSEEAGAVRAQAFSWCLLGESLLLQSRFDESMGCLARSCELHSSLGSRSGALAWQRRAEVAVCCGAYEEAQKYLERASSIATVSAMASHLWGRIHATQAFAAVEQGDPERAVRSIHAASAAAARYGDCPTCGALLNPIAAEAFGLLADLDGARAYARSAAVVAQMFTSSAWRAMAESAAGSVAMAEGDPQSAHQHLESARELYALAGQTYWAQRSHRLDSMASA